MIAFLKFVAILGIGASILCVVLAWVKEKHPRWRNFSAFVVAAGAAYSASFALDLFFGALVGFYAFSPLTIPVFTWLGISVALYYFARFVSIGRAWIAVPYLMFGAMAIVPGLLGPHRFDLATGGALIVLAILVLVFQNKSVEVSKLPK